MYDIHKGDVDELYLAGFLTEFGNAGDGQAGDGQAGEDVIDLPQERY